MSRLPLVYQWDAHRPPPRVALRLTPRRKLTVPVIPPGIHTGPVERPFNFSRAMHELCADIVSRTPELAHIDVSRTLYSITRARNGAKHGLQAKVTPLRFQGGTIQCVHRGRPYQVQRFVLDGREMLYLVSFCLPRFQNREFHEKLSTVIHELYHISPKFDGDIRRHAGRYAAHTSSQKNYDAHMAKLTERYLVNGADPNRCHFLRLSFAQLCHRHGTVVGLHLPRAKLVPIVAASPTEY